jgi:K+-sensing histidine kinase KdpD
MQILLVEDDPILGKSIKNTLELESFDVKWGQSVAETAPLVEAYEFQCMLLDIGLPDGNGISLCKKLREEFHKIPIIFLTAQTDEASELMLEFNQMAEEIEKLVDDLRDTDNLRRKLLQELAHDLRTPVASMKSLLESLLYQGERMSKDLREESLQLSLKEVDYFHHLVEDLLFLSGVHDLKYRGKISPVDVCDVIQHEVQLYNEINKSIKINLFFDEFYFVKADQHLFQRLMKNALSNAIGNAEKMVTVKIEKENEFVVIEISNDGNGLSEEDIETFGKKRATRRINENTEGRISVGLGAVIMEKICEIHSAKMSIKNNGSNGKSGASLQFKFAILDI